MMIPDLTELRYHTEVDQDDVFANFEYIDGEDGPEQHPLPDPEDLPFDEASCAMCGCPVGGVLVASEDAYGREREGGQWITTFRGPLGVVCEDCAEPADAAVARLLASEWFAPVRDLLRHVVTAQAPTHPVAVWVTTNLPRVSLGVLQ